MINTTLVEVKLGMMMEEIVLGMSLDFGYEYVPSIIGVGIYLWPNNDRMVFADGQGIQHV